MEILFYGVAIAAALLLAISSAFYPAATVVLIGLVLGVALVVTARRRVRARIANVVLDPKLSPELMLFPLLVSVRQSAILTVGLLGLLTFAMMCRTRDEEARGAKLLPLALLAGSGAVVFRTELGLPAVIAVLALGFLWVAAVKIPRTVAFPSLVTGVSVYLIANVLGQLARLPSPLDSSRLGGFESSAGLFGQRLVFPFARSINEPSVITAAYLALIVAMWMTGRKVGPLRWVGGLAGAYILIGSNSRLPLIVAALLVFATMLTPLFTRRIAGPIVFISGALPFYLPLALPVIAAVAGAVASNEYLSRGQSVKDIIGLGTRGTIWEGSTGYWLNRADLQGQLIGFGPNGHDVSGANRSYLSGLGGFLADKSYLTMHNTFLQQLFDGGLVGLGLLVVALIVVLRRFSKDVSLLPQLVFVTVLGVGAASEVILAPGFTQTTFFLLAAFAAFSPDTARSEVTLPSGIYAAHGYRGRRQIKRGPGGLRHGDVDVIPGNKSYVRRGS